MVTVHADDTRRKEDTQWIEAEYRPWENGQRIYMINCSGCHNKTAEAATGPGFGDLWGKDEVLVDGSTVHVDAEYIRKSIMEPNADIVKSYGPVSKMNSFQGKLTDEDVVQVIEYMKYLQDPDSVSDKTEGEIEKEKAAEGKEPGA